MAGAFPFASCELSDAGGIFLRLNLYSRSPVFMDFFDDYKYTNGNFAAFGSSGAGKSAMLQCIVIDLTDLSDELWKLPGANSPLAADYTMQMVMLIRSQGMADMMALDGGKYGKGILDSWR